MSRPRVSAQHCVLNATTRRHGSRPAFDLLEVSYTYAVPADTEFPRVVPRFDLFVRFVARKAGPTRVAIRVWWRAQGRRQLLHDFRPGRRLPFPADATVVSDQPLRLPNVRLVGPGLHAIEVWCRPDRRRWHRIAVEYFRIERAA